MDKRAQIVRAAGDVLHERGYEGMTLALVAAEAALPLGNLYYYFKTKEHLAAAVVDARVGELESLIARAEGAPGSSPLQRLRRFVAAFEVDAEQLVVHGCPYGSLSHDLARREGELADKARALFAVQLEWLSRQWRAMGAGARAGERATELLCAVQGACLLGLALRDPNVLRRRLRAISRRLADGIVTSKPKEMNP